MNMYAMYSYCGVNVLLVEYRGYGKSHGKPSESGRCYYHDYRLTKHVKQHPTSYMLLYHYDISQNSFMFLENIFVWTVLKS